MPPEKTVEIRDMREPRMALEEIIRKLPEIADMYYDSNTASGNEQIRADFIGHRIMECRWDLERVIASIDANPQDDCVCSIEKSFDNGICY